MWTKFSFVNLYPSLIRRPRPLLYVFIPVKRKMTSETTFDICNGRWKGKVSFSLLALCAFWALNFVLIFFIILLQHIWPLVSIFGSRNFCGLYLKDKGSAVDRYLLDLSLYLLNSISELLNAQPNTNNRVHSPLARQWLSKRLMWSNTLLCWY